MSAPSRCLHCHHKRGPRASTARKPGCTCDCHTKPKPDEYFDYTQGVDIHAYLQQHNIIAYDNDHSEFGELTHATPETH